MTLILLTILAAFSTIEQTASSITVTSIPSKLFLFTGSPNVLADNNTYRCIFVQLQDSNGSLARASQDLTIDLSSSSTIIGTAEPSITIKQGDTFGSANFTSTFNPGTTMISASATGYSTVMASITTVGPIPSAIAVYGFPSTLPADGNSYAAIMVQLQDTNGSPARAPQGGVAVSLTCSNTSVGAVTPTITILEGQTYVTANFTTTIEEKPVSAIVTAVSQGYSPSQANITTTPLALNPTKLKIFTGPSRIPADQNSYKQIAVQLQNSSGYVAQAQYNDVTVNMASNDSSVCRIDQIVIPATQTYALATLNSTYKPGSANITAVANDFLLAYQTISTFGFIPSKLAVYSLPATMPSDGKTYQIIQVQLQDSQGRPAKSTENGINVKLFSSQPNIGIVSSALTIPFGQTQATGRFTASIIPGNTSITAQASGYTTGQTTINTLLIDYYKLTASAANNGTITPSGDTSVIMGSNQTYIVTANTGYHITDLAIDNVSQGALSKYTLTNITSNHSIFASFALNTYTINVTQAPNGIITPGTSIVNYGDTPAFTVTPNTGYYICNLTVNGSQVLLNSTQSQTYQFNPLTANASLTASFAINTYTIQVAVNPNGTITPTTTIVAYNGNQTFMITPKAGYHILDVQVNGSSIGAVNSYTAQNIQGPTTISATFAVDPTSTPVPAPSSVPSPTPTPTLTPQTLSAITNDGQAIDLIFNGNITIPQITNVKIINNQSSTILSFTLTGESGSTGATNITIPKTILAPGTTAIVYIDGKTAKNQTFSEDTDNYYISFTTHFSTHQITIVFKSASTSEASAAKSALSPAATYGIIAISAIAAILIVVFVLNKRQVINLRPPI
jgi:hypothetical protein